jgi:hypothetical protein
MKNLVKYLGYSAAGLTKKIAQTGKSAVTWAVEYSKNTEKFAKGSVLITLPALLVGLALGRIGFGLDWSWLEEIGQALISFSALAAAVVVSYSYLRLFILTEAFVVATSAAKALKEEIPALSQEKAAKILAFLRGYTVWIMIISLFGMLVPIHHNLALTAVITVSFLILAGYMSANWADPGKYRLRVMTLVIMVLLTATASLVAPKPMGQLKQHLNGKLNRISLFSENDSAIDRIENAAKQKTDQVNRELLKQLYAKKAEIEQGAVKHCNGHFCTPEAQKKYAAIKRRIEAVKSGSHFDQQAGIKNRSLWQRITNPKSKFNVKIDQSTGRVTVTPKAPTPTPTGLTAVAPPPAPVGKRPPAPQMPAGSATLPPPVSRHQPAATAAKPPAPVKRRIPTPKRVEDDSYSRMLAELKKEYGDIQEIR